MFRICCLVRTGVPEYLEGLSEFRIPSALDYRVVPPEIFQRLDCLFEIHHINTITSLGCPVRLLTRSGSGV